MLYQKNEFTDYMSIILDGKVEIHSGKHDFFSEVSRWFILCPKILEQTFNSHQNKTELQDFQLYDSVTIQNFDMSKLSLSII